MCTKPQIQNGFEVSCRECDQCVATYKNTWVARCVAEKQTLPHAYAFTLTYADVDGEPPLGARVYRYKDVSDLWKRIRSAGKRKWGETIDLRYVVVGEKGTRNGRCHYHGVVFSSRPIVELGTMRGARTDGFTYKRRLNWSTWGLGFIEFQMADRKGISYALKYILKSRMTAARSEGFAREGKTEWLASSYLWCSKIPAIGEAWLFAKLEELYEKGMCPPALGIRVPGGGDWYIRGELQKRMCLFLHDANREYRERMGRNLAGWSTLIESCQDGIENQETGEIVPRKTWEWLTNGEETEPEITEAAREHANAQLDKWAEQREERENSTLFNYRHAKRLRRRCGNILPCSRCKARRSEKDFRNAETEYALEYEAWAGRKAELTERENRKQFESDWRQENRPSRYCVGSQFAGHKRSFDLLRRLKSAEPKEVQTSSR